ncbi:hypothetical protein [Bradyrhizobium erythrophlei]|uniref:Uncharacterized protein n=1 Tax=Bradyrhizobium erythrophlei TaxID=1437360 RepID=A0A1M7TFY6_9BRAD|nr:hypothetical protein [Bradyrhizobium erythrophlei]SHN69625.1 hypothetical protein SAMN05444170_1580 [Bradyrhizobium erythrophlei]
MRPIRIHLDTSDYSAMHDAPMGSPVAKIREKLTELAQSGRIEIGLSYHVVFELLQRADPEHRGNRLSRARLLSELCGRNAFPYPTDLGDGHRFSKEGLWQPRITLDDHEVEVIVGHFIQGVQQDPEATAHAQRIVTRRKYLRRWAEEYPERFADLADRNWPVMFGRSLAKDGTFGRYVAGTISRDEANRKLWFFINDPESIYELWFEQCNWDCPIMERRDNIAGKFVTMLGELRGTLARTKDLRARITAELNAAGDEALSADGRSQLLRLRRDLKTFREEISSPQQLCKDVPIWKKLFGDESALLAAEVLFAFERDKRPIKDSDGIDFVHVMYLPHADLWRGDRAFSDLLKRHKVSFGERVVPTLLELPARVEAEL